MWNLTASQNGMQFIYAASEGSIFRVFTLKHEVGKGDKEFLLFMTTRLYENITGL